MFIEINGRLHYFWLAVDQDGDAVDILVQKRRNKAAAKRFFRKLLKSQHEATGRIITDKLKSYPAAHREVLPSMTNSIERFENNRAEMSHEPTRQRERQMRRLKSAEQPAHSVVGNLLSLGRRLTRAIHYREFRLRAFCG